MTLQDLKPGFFLKENKKCYSCKFRRSVPGDTHSSCAKQNALVQVNQHGFSNGWAFHPFNFDPIWIDGCDSYVNKTYEEIDDIDQLHYQIALNINYIRSKATKLQDINMLKQLSAAIPEKELAGTKEGLNQFLKAIIDI